MKTHTRKLLIILPLLPLLMANSPAPKRETYTDLEITYVGEESLHNYNFYTLNVKNVGEGYVYYLNVSNKQFDTSFYTTMESNEICPPFVDAMINPGFDKDLVFATKEVIPESKEVIGEAYDYYVAAEDSTFTGSREIVYSTSGSYAANSSYLYNVDVQYDGAFSPNYNYCVAIFLTYDGVSCCVKSDNTEKISFRTNEKLDLSKLTVGEIKMLRSNYEYNYNYGYYNGAGCRNALNALLVFMLVFFLVLGFGIFSAIFFPAMARRRRRKALLAQDKNNEK